MADYSYKRLGIFVVLCLGVLITVKVVNDRIGREMQTMTKAPQQSASPQVAPENPLTAKQNASAPRRKPGEIVIRKDRLSPGRDYLESIFYLKNNQELARQRIINDKVVESSGEVPEGRVDFANESNNTYGTEYYQQGKKNGPSLTYFSDGRLNIEAYYQLGRLLRKKEYYRDGVIRLEVDYEDARGYSNDKETGIGRVFNKDGTLKYEWNLTNSEKIGFKKSYNQDGTLRAAFYFDEYGQPLK